jgi:hypothetical protein
MWQKTLAHYFQYIFRDSLVESLRFHLEPVLKFSLNGNIMKADSDIFSDVDFDAIDALIAENIAQREDMENGYDCEIIVHEFDFVDGEKMNRLHPDTFEIPSQIERYGVQPGNFVKVIFEADRFWVEVVEVQKVEKEKTYIGFVDNALMNDKVNYQSLVVIKPKHIISIY